jgi:hypothetical protein
MNGGNLHQCCPNPRSHSAAGRDHPLSVAGDGKQDNCEGGNGNPHDPDQPNIHRFPGDTACPAARFSRTAYSDLTLLLPMEGKRKGRAPCTMQAAPAPDRAATGVRTSRSPGSRSARPQGHGAGHRPSRPDAFQHGGTRAYGDTSRRLRQADEEDGSGSCPDVHGW